MFTKPQLSGVFLLTTLATGVCLAGKRPVVEQEPPVLTTIARLSIPHRHKLCALGWLSNHEINVEDDVHPEVVHDLDTGKETKYLDYALASFKRGHIAKPLFQSRWTWKELPQSWRTRLGSHRNQLPPGAEICDVWPSPSRRFWILRVQYTRESASDSLLHARNPARKVHYTPYAAYWVVRQDGSEPRLLGVQPGQQDGDFSERDEKGRVIHSLLYDPAWSPDETRIGFVYGDALYILPVK